ncbi:MAG: hypothetical protein EAZ53_07825 [Bacteroidetes bacterium]|nr:MAG: hypothetical protein EAZ53_07825 [Bacteroidota bacterium]
MKIKILVLFLFFTVSATFAGENSGSFTQADRERLYRLEIRMEENMKTIDAKFEASNTKFAAIQDQLNGLQNQIIGMQSQINNLFYVVLTLLAAILGSIGYSLWDRIKANAPIKESIEDVKAKNIRLTNLLKEFAEKNADFKAVFDRAALL